MAIKEADEVIRLASPDLKSVSFFASQLPLYADPVFGLDRQIQGINVPDADLYMRINKEMVSETEVTSKYDVQQLKELITEHVEATGSAKGREILDDFAAWLPKFKKLIPHDYQRMLTAIGQMEEKGLSREQAMMEAFYACHEHGYGE